MPNDMHAEEKQSRLERELKWCKSEESDNLKRTVAYRPAVSIRFSRSLAGFSHMSIFNQPTERVARVAPNGVKKGATFLLVFRCLNHTACP